MWARQSVSESGIRERIERESEFEREREFERESEFEREREFERKSEFERESEFERTLGSSSLASPRVLVRVRVC